MTSERVESRTRVPQVFQDALPETPTPKAWNVATTYAVTGPARFILATTTGMWQDNIAELIAKMATLERLNAQLRRGFNALAQRVAALEQDVEMLKAEGEIIEIREIPRKQAKDEIRRLFATGETLYYSDIVQRLQLGIELVVELCKELEVEDEIQVNGNAN